MALSSLYPVDLESLEQDFNVIRLWRENDPETVIKEHRDDVVALIAGPGRPVSRALIEALPNLEVIANFSVGTDHVDMDAAKKRGIAVTNTPDILTADTADIAVSLLLNVMRRCCEADLYLRIGKWEYAAMPLGTSLGGKKAGIVGMGRIGRAIARRLDAFDMEILYTGPHEKDDLPYLYYAGLQEMAEDADCLVLACPGGEATRHIIDYNVLEKLGKGGVLVNIARGSVVNEEDLLAALSNKAIAGAGLDVYENEPHVPKELCKMDNVVLLPHIGSATVETRTKMGHLVIENIRAHFDGKPLPSPVL